MSVAARLKELNIELPAFQEAVGTYRKCIRDGDKLYTSTHFGMDANGKTVPGKVGVAGSPGADIAPEDAKLLARNAGLRLISTLNHFLEGDLDRVDQVIQLVGVVNGVPEFTGHGEVINGCSDVLVEVFGEKGKGVRTCMGAGSLAAAVTVDLVVRIKN
mmetsp:Transcript_56382/g.115339  ORF Transcript_56382/g.115339 Transcript_56382/m.115339 type:complete len:159 (+) Transcript_56382:213-689(+)|eukprot:CAMPEP_0181311876 /NCGR_PEP_ID=MMETSP1101-20121128/13387_1 /TAXON_ID=46948 /ORGANISM="Rhodomonas abbreviata, Strain Caron Lab Isolate" /LENGTH=158 /DNA_ID=CAMNT_0023418669 /DNA_START=204 /DNA_END=680 /DNA_ORIENTATION=-